MCGIALIIGPQPDAARFASMMAALAPRGESEETLAEPGLRCGTQRLKIVDRDRARQPWCSDDGRWALCYNGEVFNFRDIRDRLLAAGAVLRSESDTEVVLHAFLHWGEAGIEQLRGEFAFGIVERSTGRAYLGRDPVGVKPLYWTRQGETLTVASEVKALVPCGTPVHEVPPGFHGWASPGEDPLLFPYVDLLHLGEGLPPVDNVDEAMRLARQAIEESVRTRVDTDLTVGVILSGGLDSSIALVTALQTHADCVAFTIGTPDSDDVAYARRLTADLGVPHEVIEINPRSIGRLDVREAIRVSELTEYGDVINAIVSNPLFAHVHRAGVKVVLAGDGSDELFGGYTMYRDVDEETRQRLFTHKIRNLARTELQRVDRTSMGNGVEVRVPFLDVDLVELALRMPIDLKVRDGEEKWILRRAFADALPDYVLQRPKSPLSHSSGLHERARLYKPLFAHMYRSFGYDLLGPMQRDFSIVLEQCDFDLDRALAATRARADYSIPEHARDFAGALRWKVEKAARRRIRRH